MNTKILYTAVSIALAVSIGCDQKPKEEPKAEPATANQVEAKPATNNTEPATNNAPATIGAVEANPADPNIAALDPAKLTETAPDEFQVKFATTEGDFTVDMKRDWAPNGVDRFYNLVKAGYYTDIAAFRVISGFMAQFGIHGDPAVNQVWRDAKIQDDPAKAGISNNVGYLTYAMAGPNTRTVQLFINFGNNAMLDSQGFRPIGKVTGNGMEVVKKWHAGYGEGAPRGQGPDQGKVQMQGNDYLKKDFPNLSYIKSVTIVGDTAAAAAPAKPAAPAKAWKAGSYQQNDLAAADIEGGKVRIKLGDDGSVVGTFQGKREGKGFSLPFKGTINDKGQINAEGSRGTNDMKVTGMFKSGTVNGNFQGNINKKGFRIAFKAE